MLDFIDKWRDNRNTSAEGKHNVIVVSKKLFPIVVDKLKDCNDIAYISIESTDDCAMYYDYDDNQHYLKDADNVLNVEFDDLTEDLVTDKYTFKAITQEQADKIVDFIEQHTDNHIVIHCKAGKSRSQGIKRFIVDMYPDKFEECEANKENPCLTPNIEVVSKLKKSFYKKCYGYEID